VSPIGSVVVGDQGALADGVDLPVVPDGGGQGQQPGSDAGVDPLQGASAVVFEGELALEGVDDGLDPVAVADELAVADGFVTAVGAHQVCDGGGVGVQMGRVDATAFLSRARTPSEPRRVLPVAGPVRDWRLHGGSASRGVVPKPEYVASGVAEGGDGEQALGEGAADDLASVSENPCDRIVDVVYVDVGQQPGLGRGEVVADPPPAEVAVWGVETGSVAVWVVDVPAEDFAVERRRLADVGGGYVEVGDRSGRGETGVGAVLSPASGGCSVCLLISDHRSGRSTRNSSSSPLMWLERIAHACGS